MLLSLALGAFRGEAQGSLPFSVMFPVDAKLVKTKSSSYDPP